MLPSNCDDDNDQHEEVNLRAQRYVPNYRVSQYDFSPEFLELETRRAANAICAEDPELTRLDNEDVLLANAWRAYKSTKNYKKKRNAMMRKRAAARRRMNVLVPKQSPLGSSAASLSANLNFTSSTKNPQRFQKFENTKYEWIKTLQHEMNTMQPTKKAPKLLSSADISLFPEKVDKSNKRQVTFAEDEVEQPQMFDQSERHIGNRKKGSADKF